MSQDSSHQVTALLDQIGRGDRQAADELLPVIYGELRSLARARMARERPGQTLQATALVHEAYLRLVGSGEQSWDNRRHFFAAAAEAMRRILIERARRVAREKHGGGQKRVSLQSGHAQTDPLSEELLAVDEALKRLEKLDPRMATVVKLRYFGGLSVEETSQVLDLAPRTINRTWTAAQAWLRREMTSR